MLAVGVFCLRVFWINTVSIGPRGSPFTCVYIFPIKLHSSTELDRQVIFNSFLIYLYRLALFALQLATQNLPVRINGPDNGNRNSFQVPDQVCTTSILQHTRKLGP